jgi:hypothetical protein
MDALNRCFWRFSFAVLLCFLSLADVRLDQRETRPDFLLGCLALKLLYIVQRLRISRDQGFLSLRERGQNDSLHLTPQVLRPAVFGCLQHGRSDAISAEAVACLDPY